MPHSSYPIDNNFTAHKSDENRVASMIVIRAEGKEFAKCGAAHCPEGRELSIARTKIEEAVFWLNAGIARQCEPRV